MTAEMKIHYMPDDEPDTPANGANEAGMPAADAPADLAGLWLRVRDGDQHAFEAVYRECSGAVFGLCLRMCGQRDAAEDALQATFIAAWEKRLSFRGDARLTTWLHRIAVNKVLGQGRSEGRLREVHDEYAGAVGGPEPAGEHPSSSSNIRLQDQALGLDLDLENAIAELPERSRQVFVLHAIHGYKHEEVGQMMGIAPGTSKAHFHRSRELLKAALAESSTGVQQ